MEQELFNELYKLRCHNGFYSASSSVDYKHTWLRDNYYCALPELWHNKEYYKQTYQTWLDYYISVEFKYNKFTSLINKKSLDENYEFPNPRLNLDLTEIHTGWNHVQIDTIGYFLLGIAQGENNNIKIIRNQDDLDIINKAILMLDAINYISVPESGAWEENRECYRSSTIGAVLAGLIGIKTLDDRFNIPINIIDKLINESKDALITILPNETPTRNSDLAQLFLIYPFNVLDEDMSKTILNQIENKLLKDNGVIRYVNDKYFNCNGEAEWTFGLAYLGIIYLKLKNLDKSRYYLNLLLSNGILIPELYYSKTNIGNDNKPLAWTLALTIELNHLIEIN